MSRFGTFHQVAAVALIGALLAPATAQADQPMPAAVDAALPAAPPASPASAEELGEEASAPAPDETGEPPRVTTPGIRVGPPIQWGFAAAPTAPATAPIDISVDAEPAPLPIDTVGSETIEIIDSPPPGAHTELDESTLERAEHNDIHKVLAAVAGVYLRDEDGYGLRPNIGMRGAAAERSAKVALMEDGVLIAPAPYSAPAAYYFPLVTRMSRVEVVKGPAAILYGPNTVGGAVNLVGAPIPGERAGYLDVALGSDVYGKLHGRIGEGGERWGVLAEYVKLRTDGFKELDGGGDTGFDKNDLQLSARVSTTASARVYQRLEARVGYATEASDETYTGLTDADFRVAPQRRYVATRDDHMDWDHWRFRLAHTLELGTWLTVETTAYRHQFDRAWGKVDAFVGQRDFAGLLANPMSGSNPIFYAVLTGAADSSSPEDELIRGTNDRQFVSQGIQARAEVHARAGPTDHTIEAGVRVHYDRAERARYEDAFRMTNRELVASPRGRQTVLDSTAETLAISLHAQDEVRWGPVELVAGTRVELIDIGFEDHRMPDAPTVDGNYTVVIPGGGAQYHVTDAISVLAGVHRGFVPVAPSASNDVDPESSVNYEAGARWRSPLVQADVIGFFSNYSNLKGSCTFSTGCRAEQEGEEFNGGRVHIWGAEVQAAADVALPAGLRLPLKAAYTLTQTEFQTAFSADFAGWGEVMIGDELPYLPEHQLNLGTAIAARRWELGTVVRWRGELRDQAGQGEVPVAEEIPSLLTVDLTAHLQLGRWGELYGTCDNVLDEQQIVSRRPYGARPNAPRLFAVGYKARF
jgi:Fe(3+) dicitrate transport protein